MKDNETFETRLPKIKLCGPIRNKWHLQECFKQTPITSIIRPISLTSLFYSPPKVLYTSNITPIAQKLEFWVKMTHLLKKNITTNHFLKFIFKLVSLVPHRYHVIKKKFIILIKFSIDN